MEYVSEELISDSKFINKSFDYVDVTKYAGETKLSDKDIILNAIRKGELYCFAFVSEELKNNKDFMLQAIELNRDCIGYSSNELLSDSDFMIKVIKIDPKCINFANVNMKFEEDFMLQAIEQDIWCLWYARDNLLTDEKFMLQAIKKQGFGCLEYDKSELRNNKDFMLQAIRIDIRCYAYASEKLRHDEEILSEINQYT